MTRIQHHSSYFQHHVKPLGPQHGSASGASGRNDTSGVVPASQLQRQPTSSRTAYLLEGLGHQENFVDPISTAENLQSLTRDPQVQDFLRNLRQRTAHSIESQRVDVANFLAHEASATANPAQPPEFVQGIVAKLVSTLALSANSVQSTSLASASIPPSHGQSSVSAREMIARISKKILAGEITTAQGLAQIQHWTNQLTATQPSVGQPVSARPPSASQVVINPFVRVAKNTIHEVLQNAGGQWDDLARYLKIGADGKVFFDGPMTKDVANSRRIMDAVRQINQALAKVPPRFQDAALSALRTEMISLIRAKESSGAISHGSALTLSMRWNQKLQKPIATDSSTYR